MKLTREKAEKMLAEERARAVDNRWVDHCLSVGEAAGRIATALAESGVAVDADKAAALGCVHDIGKYNGESRGHERRGYEYLKAKGYDDEDCAICMVHPYLNNDILCTAAGVLDKEKYRVLAELIKTHNYTLEEKIVGLCDLMCVQGKKICTVDKRLIDIIMRRGAYPNTQYHVREVYKLKQYFDDLLGYDLYELFPEVKENL